ncbi:MAG: SRPBCC family protein [Deltaproteobacteria bacterium]|nr:SRPBCC family protein [Deltaproteobacteria bacterium]
MTTSDRIEKRVFLRATVEKVWGALSEAQAFGAWFGVDFDGPFVAGQRITGRMRPTQVDPQIAEKQAPYTGMPFEFWVDRLEPPHLISFRWHPFAIDPQTDYSKEPTTLIVFRLEVVEGGTQLVVTESGFDQVPLQRRLQAFTSNEEGWTLQCRLIQKYVERHGS